MEKIQLQSSVRWAHYVISIGLLLSWVAQGWASTYLSPTVSVVASPDASVLIRVQPGNTDRSGPPAQATVFKLDPASGNYTRFAEFDLRNPVAPSDVLITNNAQFVITLDDWGPSKVPANALVVYKGSGELVRAWSIDEIFTDSELKQFVRGPTEFIWRDGVTLKESEEEGPTVIIPPEVLFTRAARLKVRRTLVLDLNPLSFERVRNGWNE